MPRPNDFLARAGIPVIDDLDTRALVRHLRTRGVMRGVLSATERDPRTLVDKARAIPTMAGLDLASRVSTPERYEWTQAGRACSPSDLIGDRPRRQHHVVAYDFGIKHNILRRLVQAGCRVTVVPAAHLRRRRARPQARRHLPLQRPGRSRAAPDAGRQHPQADRQEADLRHLPRPPDCSASLSAAKPTS